MTAITLDELEPEVRRRLEERSRREGLSLPQMVQKLLGEALGVARTTRSKTRGLAELAGTWSPEEAEAFDGALADQRRIDTDEWR